MSAAGGRPVLVGEDSDAKTSMSFWQDEGLEAVDVVLDGIEFLERRVIADSDRPTFDDGMNVRAGEGVIKQAERGVSTFNAVAAFQAKIGKPRLLAVDFQVTRQFGVEVRRCDDEAVPLKNLYPSASGQ